MLITADLRIVSATDADILAKDWKCTLHETNSHPSVVVVSATDEISSSWNSMWYEALEQSI